MICCRLPDLHGLPCPATYGARHRRQMDFHKLFQYAIAAHGVCTVIANLTPTPKDDAILAGAYRIIEILGGIVTPRAKQ